MLALAPGLGNNHSLSRLTDVMSQRVQNRQPLARAKNITTEEDKRGSGGPQGRPLGMTEEELALLGNVSSILALSRSVINDS
jgi:hypothetical protein